MYKELSEAMYRRVAYGMYAANVLAQSGNVLMGDTCEDVWIPSHELYINTAKILSDSCGTIDEHEKAEFLIINNERDIIGKFAEEYADEIIDDPELFGHFIEDLMRYIVVAGSIIY